MLDSWARELIDKLAAAAAAQLLALLQALLHGIGWGAILLFLAALFSLIVIVKALFKTRVLIFLAVLCLIGGYCLSKGVSFDIVRSYVAGVSGTRSE